MLYVASPLLECKGGASGLNVFGVKLPIVREGDDLVSASIQGAEAMGTPILDGDIVVFSAKVVGVSQGRLICLKDVTPSEDAIRLSKKFKLEPEFAEVVLNEADSILGGVDYALLTLKNGVLIANAGVDQSNAPPGQAALWPKDLEGSARELREGIKKRGLDVGVLIIDSRTMPLRMGSSGVALGISGFSPVEDLRGKEDLFGRPMKIKRAAIADDLASAANLIMGETSESVPVAVVRGAPVRFEEGHSIAEALIPMDQCLIMHLMPCRRG
jgi:coenzyme F420-0:L-glutamate ligase